MKNVFMSEKGTQGKEIIVQAKEGELKFNQYGDRYVLLRSGKRYESGTGGGADWRVMDFDTYELLLEVKADSIYAAKDAEAVPFAMLFAHRTPINNAQILWRLCWPIASAVLALLAIPLSYTNPRQGRSLSLVVAVLLFIVYLNGITMMQTWVKAQKISWIEGLILVNLVMFALACLLMVRRVWMQSWLPQSLAGTIHEMRQKLPVRRGGRS
jgi:lipopolysaccharide export system permease protein